MDQDYGTFHIYDLLNIYRVHVTSASEPNACDGNQEIYCSFSLLWKIIKILGVKYTGVRR